MTLFPNSPTSGDQVTFNETTFEWDGSRWIALGSISVGPQGSQGVTGNTGATGPTGPQGNTGADGVVGVSIEYTAGDEPPTGMGTGDFWLETDTGLYYAYVWDGSTLGWLQISGPRGATGATGPQGDQGIQGNTGATGPQGDQGIQGNTGATGPVGDYVESFNGATGAIEGVSSVNGQTGDVHASPGFRYRRADLFDFYISSEATGDVAFDGSNFAIHFGTLESEYIGYILEEFESNVCGALLIRNADSSLSTLIKSSETYIGISTSNSRVYSVLGSHISPLSELNTNVPASGEIYVEYIPVIPDNNVKSVNGQTGDVYADRGLRFIFDNTSFPAVGEISIGSAVSVYGDISFNTSTEDGDDITSLLASLSQTGFDIIVKNGDGTEVAYYRNPTFSYTAAGIYIWTLDPPAETVQTASFTVGEVVYVEFLPYQTNVVNSFNGATGAIEGVSSVNGQTGDVTTTVTSSYAGHIYSPSEGTYYLDPRAPIGRTITEFYAICGTGGISADLYNSGATVGSINVSTTGATASLSNTSLAQDGTLELVTSNYSVCYDFRFAVRYTQ